MAARKQAGDSWRAASLRLAQLIRRKRHARQQSQEGVARHAGLATSTVRKIESNSIQEPGVFTVLALMDALDVPLAELQALLRSDSAPDPAEDATSPD
jgi:transcriptional regulator with XRE-family HTH domain